MAKTLQNLKKELETFSRILRKEYSASVCMACKVTADMPTLNLIWDSPNELSISTMEMYHLMVQKSARSVPFPSLLAPLLADTLDSAWDKLCNRFHICNKYSHFLDKHAPFIQQNSN